MKKKRSLAEKLRAMYAVATDRHDANGNEIPDPTKVAMPVGFREPPTIQEMLHQALRGQAIQLALQQRGEETLEDSMDFDVDEDPDVTVRTPYETLVMQEEVIKEGALEARRKPKAPPKQPEATPPPPKT